MVELQKFEITPAATNDGIALNAITSVADVRQNMLTH